MDSIIRGANWYVEELNQRKRLEEVTLPALKREMTKFAMGGGYFGLELPAEISPLSAEASMNGSHDDIRSRFGREPGDWTTCYYYEALLNAFPTGDSTGQPKLKGRVVILKGLLNEVTQAGVKGVNASGQTKFTWSSIVLYHDVVDGRTIHKFDIANNTLSTKVPSLTAIHIDSGGN
jgi:P2 family phage contractile tail tube protein